MNQNLYQNLYQNLDLRKGRKKKIIIRAKINITQINILNLECFYNLRTNEEYKIVTSVFSNKNEPLIPIKRLEKCLKKFHTVSMMKF